VHDQGFRLGQLLQGLTQGGLLVGDPLCGRGRRVQSFLLILRFGVIVHSFSFHGFFDMATVMGAGLFDSSRRAEICLSGPPPQPAGADKIAAAGL
jgi:hypothetical protein